METNAATLDTDDASTYGSVENEPDHPVPLDPSELMSEALAWVEKNQTLAMLGAFALGVFIGALMRD